MGAPVRFRRFYTLPSCVIGYAPSLITYCHRNVIYVFSAILACRVQQVCHRRLRKLSARGLQYLTRVTLFCNRFILGVIVFRASSHRIYTLELGLRSTMVLSIVLYLGGCQGRAISNTRVRDFLTTLCLYVIEWGRNICTRTRRL